MTPALSQVCTLNAPFDQDVKDYAAGKCAAIEIWWTKLETYLRTHSLDDARRLLDQHEMTAPVASIQGGLLVSQGESRKAHWDHFAQRLDLCRTLGIGTLVVACDIPGPLTQEILDRTSVSLTEMAQCVGQRGLRVALEFQRMSAFGNNLQTAAAMVGECGSPSLGICFDAFHFFVGPSKLSDLGYLTGENLFHVQLCDLAGVARELAADADRILPGDGDFQLEPIVEHLCRIAYAGHISIELMNPQIWQVPSSQFGEIAMASLRKVLGIAE